MGLLMTFITILCMPHEGHGQSHTGSCLTTTPSMPGRESPGQDPEPERGKPAQAPEGWAIGDYSAPGGMDKGSESKVLGGLPRPGNAAPVDVWGSQSHHLGAGGLGALWGSWEQGMSSGVNCVR